MRELYTEDLSIAGRRAEIEEKLIRVRALLENEKKEAFLFLKHPNFSWITAGAKGFVANCFDDSAIAILVTKTGAYAICNVIEEPRVKEEEHLEELGFEFMVYAWQKNGIHDAVKKQVGNVNTVLCDTPFAEACVATDLLRPLRIQFTKNEIGRWLHLGDVMSKALEEYLATVTPGMTEYEIAGGISKALWKHNIEQVMHLVSVDERVDKYRHALPTDKKLRNNLLVAINGRYKGLVTTVSRMVYCGKPSEEFSSQYRDCCDMEMETMFKAQVGADELEMYDTLRQAYDKRGYSDMFDKHGQGGCQGYWPREYMITPDAHYTVRENMAYCYNPVVDGTKAEDAFLVLPEGLTHITRPISFPKINYDFNGKTYERPDILVID